MASLAGAFAKKMAEREARMLAERAKNEARKFALRKLNNAKRLAQQRASALITKHLGNTNTARLAKQQLNRRIANAHRVATNKVNSSGWFPKF